MKKSRFSEDQVANALRQAEAGTPVGDMCRQIGMAEATITRPADKRLQFQGESGRHDGCHSCC